MKSPEKKSNAIGCQSAVNRLLFFLEDVSLKKLMRQIESPPLTDRQTGLTAEVPEVDATVNFGSAPMLEAVESHRATGNPMGNVGSAAKRG